MHRYIGIRGSGTPWKFCLFLEWFTLHTSSKMTMIGHWAPPPPSANIDAPSSAPNVVLSYELVHVSTKYTTTWKGNIKLHNTYFKNKMNALQFTSTCLVGKCHLPNLWGIWCCFSQVIIFSNFLKINDTYLLYNKGLF